MGDTEIGEGSRQNELRQAQALMEAKLKNLRASRNKLRQQWMLIHDDFSIFNREFPSSTGFGAFELARIALMDSKMVPIMRSILAINGTIQATRDSGFYTPESTEQEMGECAYYTDIIRSDES